MILKKRGPNKIQTDYTLKDIYQYYLSITEKALQVDYKTYTQICLKANTLIAEEILTNSATVKFPARTGHLRIMKSKLVLLIPRLKVDWAASNKTGKRVYHLNEHRQGYKYRFHWAKRDCNATNKAAYSFTPARTLKRRLAYILKNEPTIDYYE